MIKVVSGNSIYIGLTKANVERMAERDPVLFNFRDLGLPSYWACVAQKEDTIVALDNEIVKLQPLVFCFTTKALKEMERKPFLVRIDGRPHWLKAYTITIFVVEDEYAGEEFVRRRLGPETVVTRRGFMPGDFPSRN